MTSTHAARTDCRTRTAASACPARHTRPDGPCRTPRPPSASSPASAAFAATVAVASAPHSEMGNCYLKKNQ